MTGDSRDGVWKLLTAKQLTKDDKFSAAEINKYLLLLKTGGIEMILNYKKSVKIGIYIKQLGEKAILDNNPRTGNLKLDDDDLQYYTKLVTEIPNKKKN